VKGLKKNLLSIGRFDYLGIKTQIKNGIMKVAKGAPIVMKAEKIYPNHSCFKQIR